MRKTIIASAEDDWFHKLSREKQQDYIKNHPDSKYAKTGVKKKSALDDKSLLTSICNLWRGGADETDILNFLKKQKVSDPQAVLNEFKASKGH